MDDFSGRGLAGSGQSDEGVGGNASSAGTTPDAFGLEKYTGSPTQSADRTESTQPARRTEPIRAVGREPSNQSGWRRSVRWETKLGEPIVGGLAVHENRLIGTGRSGRVYALDGTDGIKRWQSSGDRIATTPPTVCDGLAFVGMDDGRLRAFDVTDGSVQWTSEIDGAIEASPIARDGTVYVTSDRGAVYLFDATRGDRRAAFGHGSQAVASLAVDRETILLGSAGGGLQARCTTDGRERWRRLPEQAVAAPPVLTEAHAFVATIDDATVLAIDRVTGAIHHQFQVESAIWGRPVVTEETLVVASQDGVVSAFDRESGSCRWRVELRGSIWCGPVGDSGRVFVADDYGQMHSLDESSGEERWRFDADAVITTAPSVVNDTVVVTTEAGSVYALSETEI